MCVEADAAGDAVIVATHVPVHPLVANTLESLAWDFEHLLALLKVHRCVKVVLAGHDHRGGYYMDAGTGVHHITVPGMLEAEPGTKRYAILELGTQYVLLRGEGRLQVCPGRVNVAGTRVHARGSREEWLDLAAPTALLV